LTSCKTLDTLHCPSALEAASQGAGRVIPGRSAPSSRRDSDDGTVETSATRGTRCHRASPTPVRPVHGPHGPAVGCHRAAECHHRCGCCGSHPGPAHGLPPSRDPAPVAGSACRRLLGRRPDIACKVCGMPSRRRRRSVDVCLIQRQVCLLRQHQDQRRTRARSAEG